MKRKPLYLVVVTSAFRLAIGCIAVLGMSQATATTQEEPSIHLGAGASLTEDEVSSLEQLLTEEAQRQVDAQEKMEGQSAKTTVSVMLGKNENVLWVDLGKGYVPSNYGAEFEEHLQEIDNVLVFRMEGIAPVRGVKFLFDGNATEYYFPDEFESDRQVRHLERYQRNNAAAASPHVMVAAGHGLYYHHKFKKWTTARDEVNGVVEDFVTPSLAETLEAFLRVRSDAIVTQARPLWFFEHSESGELWWKVSARYSLKKLYPELSHIWNNKAGKQGGLVERDEDINSRPLYANHREVDALIHLHTNAEPTGLTRGIRVYHAPGRMADKNLAESALCYMKESLSSSTKFADFPVSSYPHEGNQGENRRANIPSIIAEIGFHTNVEDAAAILDPDFVRLTMRGLEKGYRMFREGKRCESFAITSYPDLTIPLNNSAKVEVAFVGYPRFPVEFDLTPVECPKGFNCWPSWSRIEEETPTFKVTHNCSGSTEGTIIWNAKFTDADGIVAQAKFKVGCTT